MRETAAVDERFLHRLEAFSDIVMGFSLAQLSLNLVIPGHAIEIYTRPIGLIAFFFTFSIVVTVWYSHHRLFNKYFVPNRAMVLLNFAMLAFTVLLIYMLEVYTHFAPDLAEGTIAGAGYCGSFAIVYALLTVLFALGTRARWKALTVADRTGGIQATVRLGLIAIGAVVGCTTAWLLHLPIGTGFTAIFVAMLLARVVNSRVARGKMGPNPA